MDLVKEIMQKVKIDTAFYSKFSVHVGRKDEYVMNMWVEYVTVLFNVCSSLLLCLFLVLVFFCSMS